jgi:thiamine biosynthesis lipoprotein
MTAVTGIHHVEMVMGMPVSIDVRDDIDPAAIDEVVRWLHHVDATFSTYKVESPISRYGLGEITIDDLSDEVRAVLAQCDELYDETGGIFDIHSVPAPNGSMLDPSGLVKGWSLERAAAILEAHGARNLCINGGGDIALRGEPTPGEPWKIGIRHPEQPDQLATVVQGHGPFAIATSATYERGAHIIDPRIGAPTTELASVTIIGLDLTMVDAYATTVFVMGLEGLVWIDAHPGFGGYAITHDGMTYSTPVFDTYR